MKKITFLIIGLFLLLIASGCSRENLNIGVTKTDKEFIVTYTRLNRQENHQIYLTAGTVIDVKIENNGGKLDVSVRGDENIYTGNNPVSCTFALTIPENGYYTFTVYGDNAKGSVSFIVR